MRAIKRRTVCPAQRYLTRIMRSLRGNASVVVVGRIPPSGKNVGFGWGRSYSGEALFSQIALCPCVARRLSFGPHPSARASENLARFYRPWDGNDAGSVNFFRAKNQLVESEVERQAETILLPGRKSFEMSSGTHVDEARNGSGGYLARVVLTGSIWMKTGSSPQTNSSVLATLLIFAELRA